MSTDDDWEQDFDVELTEEDMKAADEIAKKLNLSATDYTKLTGDLVSYIPPHPYLYRKENIGHFMIWLARLSTEYETPVN